MSLIVCTCNTKYPLAQKRVRAVLSRWGQKTDTNTFVCPKFAKDGIIKELNNLRLNGWEILVTISIFSGKGMKTGEIKI